MYLFLFLFKRYVNYSNVYSDRNLLIMFIFISIVLILIIILNIIVSAELFVNNNKYIEVYNYIHNKNILVINCFDNKNKNNKNKSPNWKKILLKIILTIRIIIYALKIETILYYSSFF